MRTIKKIQFVLFIVGCSQSFISCQAPAGNHLMNETSPYLLQHAHNPVDWYPWSPAALKKALEQDKLLVVSIGYSSCHWCHVMEKESFSDTAVSRLMNKHFVSIKVDREERPDIDDVYMTACQMVSGGACGWPLNVIALPDGKPVFAGTYFPKKRWIEILDFFVRQKAEQADKLREYADQLAQGLQETNKLEPTGNKPVLLETPLHSAAQSLLASIDTVWGGKKAAPKFPMPNNYEFLLAYHHWSKDTKALSAIETTLQKMAAGGIYDHLEGGFARYSTDIYWKIPHFEKMLYDNGQLLSLYAHAYQLTRNPEYQATANGIYGFLKYHLLSPEGGFYSSFDADSEGEEGKYYVWTYQEVQAALADQKLFDIARSIYNLTPEGNWEHGKNILSVAHSQEEILSAFNLKDDQYREALSSIQNRLLQARLKKTRPHRDDKILCAWNALAIAGLADAFFAFGDPGMRSLALTTGDFIWNNLHQPDNSLFRSYKDGKANINAFLDDYAFTGLAFLKLYQISFDEQWIHRAKELATYAVEHFSDTQSDLFFYTSKLDPPLIARKMEIEDNVIPGSNSAMATLLYYLGIYLDHPDFHLRAGNMVAAMTANIRDTQYPDYLSNWLKLYLQMLHPPFEVAVVGDHYDATRNELAAKYLPNTLWLGGSGESSLALLENKLIPGQTTIYVCRNKVCKLPVTQVEQAWSLINYEK